MGGGGGRGDGGTDSAHHGPGVPPLDGTEMGGALLAVAGATAGAVTFSKSHFLQKKKKIHMLSGINIKISPLYCLLYVDDCTCTPFCFQFATITTQKYTYTCMYTQPNYSLERFNTWQ